MKLSKNALLVTLVAAALCPSRAQAQNLIVSGQFDGNLYEFNPSGVIVNTTPVAGAANVAGLAFDKTGNLFVADSGNGNIYKFSPDGTQSTIASGLGAPLPLAFDSAGNLYTGGPEGTIYEIAASGSVSTFALFQPTNLVYGLAFDDGGNLFAAELFNGYIAEYKRGGTSSSFGVGSPYGLVFDGAGNLFVSDYFGGTIQKLAPDGTQSTFASGLSEPTDLAFDTSSNLFVVSDSDNIYKIAPNGTFSVFASGIDSAGIVFRPTGLQVITQPQSQVGYWGSSASFSVGVAAGFPPYSFQWMKANASISGATNSVLVLTNLQATDAATYTVVVSDTVTNITSQPATLTVEPAGTSIALHTGVDILGVVGQTYGVQATTNLNLTMSWIGLANVTLTTTNQTIWYDPIPATLAHRFYRVVPRTITIP